MGPGGGGGGRKRRREEKRREREKHTQQHSFTRPGVGGECLVVDGQVVVVLDEGGSVLRQHHRALRPRADVLADQIVATRGIRPGNLSLKSIVRVWVQAITIAENSLVLGVSFSVVSLMFQVI